MQLHCPKHGTVFESSSCSGVKDFPTDEGHPDCPRCKEETKNTVIIVVPRISQASDKPKEEAAAQHKEE